MFEQANGRVVLEGIDASAFQHPLDRQATDQLKRVPHFDLAMRKIIEFGFERFRYIEHNSNSIRVTSRQFGRLHAMLREACTILDMPEPAMYVSQGGLNAFTSGHDNPYIVLFTGLIDTMDDDELMAVIAHELGHIKCSHVLYTSMASNMGALIELAGSMAFGVGGPVSMALSAGLQGALLTWSRRSELSADRAALLVMQDPRPCITMLMKLAGGVGRMSEDVSAEEFLAQARAYKEESERGFTDKLYTVMNNLMFRGTHPYTIERAMHLNQYIDSAEYEQIVIHRTYARRPGLVRNGSCPQCEKPVAKGYMFCGGCGMKLEWR